MNISAIKWLELSSSFCVNKRVGTLFHQTKGDVCCLSFQTLYVSESSDFSLNTHASIRSTVWKCIEFEDQLPPSWEALWQHYMVTVLLGSTFLGPSWSKHIHVPPPFAL